MTGDRYRLVTHSGTEEHVSIPLSAEETFEHLSLEEALHKLSNWDVVRLRTDSERFPRLLCYRGSSYREIYVRRFTPMTDA